MACQRSETMTSKLDCFPIFDLKLLVNIIFFRKCSLAGLLAGAAGQFVASPTDLVKVNMQMEGRRRLEGKPPR